MRTLTTTPSRPAQADCIVTARSICRPLTDQCTIGLWLLVFCSQHLSEYYRLALRKGTESGNRHETGSHCSARDDSYAHPKPPQPSFTWSGYVGSPYLTCGKIEWLPIIPEFGRCQRKLLKPNRALHAQFSFGVTSPSVLSIGCEEWISRGSCRKETRNARFTWKKHWIQTAGVLVTFLEAEHLNVFTCLVSGVDAVVFSSVHPTLIKFETNPKCRLIVVFISGRGMAWIKKKGK